MSDLQLAGEESPFPEQSRLEELVHDVIQQASGLGADGVAAGVSIDAGLAEYDAVISHRRGIVDHLRGMQEGFRGNAADVQAHPAEHVPTLDQNHVHAEVGCTKRRSITTRPCADYNELSLMVRHYGVAWSNTSISESF